MALGAKGILDLQLLRYFPCIVYNFSFLKKFERNATCQLTSTDSNCANFTEILAISCSRFTCSPSHKLMFQLVYRFVHGCCVKRNLKPCLHPPVANNNICKTFCQQSCMLAIEKVLAAYKIIFYWSEYLVLLTLSRKNTLASASAPKCRYMAFFRVTCFFAFSFSGLVRHIILRAQSFYYVNCSSCASTFSFPQTHFC